MAATAPNPANASHPDIRLILTDVDGTILPADRDEASPTCVAAFHAALEAGIHVGAASGRGATRVPQVFGGDKACCRTLLAANGMQVWIPESRLEQWQRAQEAQKRDPQRQAQSRNVLSSKIASALRDSRT